MTELLHEKLDAAFREFGPLLSKERYAQVAEMHQAGKLLPLLLTYWDMVSVMVTDEDSLDILLDTYLNPETDFICDKERVRETYPRVLRYVKFFDKALKP